MGHLKLSHRLAPEEAVGVSRGAEPPAAAEPRKRRGRPPGSRSQDWEKLDEHGESIGREYRPKPEKGSPKCPECREVAQRKHPEYGYWICGVCWAISDDTGEEIPEDVIGRMVGHGRPSARV
jgi:hypothetical protein